VRIGVDSAVFARFPDYRRGLVVARNIANREPHPELEQRLRRAEETVHARLAATWKEDPRVAAWLGAFRRLGVNPNNRPPANAALVKRVAKGASLPLVNPVVALMNVTSLENLVPCGGDDLAAVSGDLLLRPARGGERYRPLGRPEQLDPPDEGELILVDSADEVLCRLWCWRNSDITKITEQATEVALNLDLMGPAVPPADGDAMTERLAADLRRYCGGEVEWHMLTPESPAVEASPG